MKLLKIYKKQKRVDQRSLIEILLHTRLGTNKKEWL